MKKAICIVMTMILIASISACGSKGTQEAPAPAENVYAEEAAAEPEAETEEPEAGETSDMPEESGEPEPEAEEPAPETGEPEPETVTEEADTADHYAMYADMVSAYKRYYEENDTSAASSETPVFTNTSMVSGDKICYGLYDLDGNGVEELFIYRFDNEFEIHYIIDIVQITDGEISHVFEGNEFIGASYGQYNTLTPGKNGNVSIYCHYGAMSGGWHLYHYNGKSLDYVDGFDFVGDEPYREDEDRNRIYITDEEADEIRAMFVPVEVSCINATEENIEKLRNMGASQNGSGESSGNGGAKVNAAKVTLDVSYDDNEYGIIKGLDDSGNVIWQKETGHYLPSQLDHIKDIGIANGYYYYIENGYVITLDLATGSEIWKAEFPGSPAESAILFDNDGKLYLAGYLGPDLCVIDKNGEVLFTKGSFDDDIYWPYMLQKNGDRLYIVYEGTSDMNYSGAQVIVDANSYEVIDIVRFTEESSI